MVRSKLEAIVGVFDEIIIAIIVLAVILWGLVALGFLSPAVALALGIVLGASVLMLGFVLLRPQLLKPKVGPESLVGRRAEAVSELNPEGMVMINGEYWRATSLEPIGKGEEVVVVGVDGLRLKVKPVKR